MKSVTLVVFSLSSFIFTIIPSSLSATPCHPQSCHTVLGPEIRFPFWIPGRQPSTCGPPGFELSCTADNQTILNLPESGSFVVDHIDYPAQALFINDPDSCLPGRILNFTASGSPFRGAYTRNYTFLNCSSDYLDYSSTRHMPLYCLSGRNYTVLAMRSGSSSVPENCRRIKSVVVPLQWTLSQYYWASMDLREDLQLVWNQPLCRDCEIEGGRCGFADDDLEGNRVACFRRSRSAIPRGAKYGIIIGVGIPGFVCLVGLACYGCGMIRAFNLRRSLDSNLPTTVSNQRPVISRYASGLDAPTIESYPTTVLGESRRLPKPTDVCCPICLSDYQPKETLRSIPECNHYFHADCIDEWLKLNGTCPLCRNSPLSSVATPCFSLSLSSSSSSPSTLDSR